MNRRLPAAVTWADTLVRFNHFLPADVLCPISKQTNKKEEIQTRHSTRPSMKPEVG